MTIHIEHISSVIRVYRPGESYAAGNEPKAVATVARTDTGAAEIMAAKGQLTRGDMREIALQLAAAGVRVLVIKRPRGRGVPGGRLVRSQGPFSYYEVRTEGL
ncbi:MAG: hypothetical protein ACK4KV_19060 [Rhodocyclaceae bacterium]